MEKEIIEAIKFIKKNSPKLHLYVAGKLLERTERGTHQIKRKDIRRALGSVFHIAPEHQIKILNELVRYRLILKINKERFLIPITSEDYQDMILRH